ncbi:MAG TPA: hypothetical protein VGO52_12200 [Hyphomonadaceae bacterium]|jgi:hypothetical protein|nr:hypothetical protein [Hyphomonadaceae bacterium]
MAIGRLRVEGHAIVSADGMIADARGEMPARLRNDADWRYFQDALDRAALVVLGRLGHARHPNPGRRRLVLTHQIDALEQDRHDPLATFWNPAGLSLTAMLDKIGVREGTLAITGGTGSFDLFLPHYDRFVLAEVHGFLLPGGTPCFSGGHPHETLAAAGLKPGETHTIDPSANVTQTDWTR